MAPIAWRDLRYGERSATRVYGGALTLAILPTVLSAGPVRAAAILLLFVLAITMLTSISPGPLAFPAACVALAAAGAIGALLPGFVCLGYRALPLVQRAGVLALAVAVLAIPAPYATLPLVITAGQEELRDFAVVLGAHAVVFGVLPVVLGRALAVRQETLNTYRERADQAERERGLLAREAVLLERGRIAREAHDVLGHRLSLISMYAGGLEMNQELGSAERSAQARQIRECARESVEDLRAILDLLGRDDDLTLDPLASGQGLRGVQGVIEGGRAAGMDIVLEAEEGIEARLDRAPFLTRQALVRIVQEGLTNAARHGDGGPLTVTLRTMSGDQLEVSVANRRAEPAAGQPGSRRGLAGLAERARVAGGTLEVLPTASTFLVRGSLPFGDDASPRMTRP